MLENGLKIVSLDRGGYVSNIGMNNQGILIREAVSLLRVFDLEWIKAGGLWLYCVGLFSP